MAYFSVNRYRTLDASTGASVEAGPCAFGAVSPRLRGFLGGVSWAQAVPVATSPNPKKPSTVRIWNTAMVSRPRTPRRTPGRTLPFGGGYLR